MPYSKSIAIFICICCLLVNTSAQCPDSGKLNITATLYKQENGLSSDMLTEIVKDSTGYRYFLGVDMRWIRYDGVNFSAKTYPRFSFVHYGLKNFATDEYTDQYVGNIHYKVGKDKNGKAYKWGINGDSLIWVNVPANKQESFQLPKELSPIRTGFFPHGEVCWVTTSGKVFRFDIGSKKFLAMTLPGITEVDAPWQEPLFIFFRPDGTTYLLMREMILKLNSTSLSFEKLCTISQFHSLTCLPQIIMNAYLYIAHPGAIIDEIYLKNGSVNKINLADSMGIKNSSALKITSLQNYHDYLLIGTSNAGLFIFNRCTRFMQHFLYEKQDYRASLTNSVAWLQVDDENVIWMQTEAGLIKLEVNNQRIKTYLPSSAEPDGVCDNCNNVRAIYTLDNNNLLIGSFGGVHSFNQNSEQFGNLISSYDGQSVWSNHPVSAVTGDGKGNIFIGGWTNDEILLLNNQKKKLVNILKTQDNPQFSYSYLHCLFYDSHHVLWVGTREGFLRITNLDEFEKNDFTGKITVSNKFPGLRNQYKQPGGTCFTIKEDSKGNIWMGTANGLYMYNYTTDSLIKYIHIPGDGKSISDNEVRSILISKDDNVWIGTISGGLNYFNLSTKTFTAFTNENGLPNNSIYTILEDHSGFLWLGTTAGLCRFSKTDHSVRNYTPRDGIQNFEFNTNAATETADGRLCFGGRTGFNIFQPDSMNTTISPPKVVISQFRIFDKEYPVPDSVLRLSHDENSFSFYFAALNYYRSNDNQYAYMMEGADKDWIKAGNRQYTSYNNLPPGTYTFKVRAANYTGMWNKQITSMSFIINPAWYNTWWFRGIIGILICGIIYGLYKYRLSQVIKLQAVRNRIASDLHDEIGSTLSSISLSSMLIQGKLNGSNAEAEKLLQQVSSNTDSMMEALSDIVWAINTRNDRFDNVVNRMRAFAIEILEPFNINIQFNVSEDVLNIQLDMQQRKNVYLIFKEAVNNIAKYSGCKNVYIDISRGHNKTFALHIKDDGKGFDETSLGNEGKSLSGNGIRNIKKRALELAGEVTIHSVPAEGTTLNLKFTIKNH